LGNLKDLDVPSRAEALLQARLDQLTAPDRELLRCAAVIGEVFWEGALVELGLDQVEARLDALAQTDLVRLRPTSRFPGTRQWTFKSELMAEVARSNLPVRDRKQIHQSMAEWLGRQDQRDPDTLSLRAHHLMEAGQRSAALDVMAEAGRLSERQMRWQVALASYMRAYELARSEGDEASSLYFATHVGRLGVRAHTPSKSVDVLKQSAELAEKSGEEAMQANLLQLLGRSLAIQGAHEQAREVTERALAVAEKRGDLRLKFETTKALGFVLYYGDTFQGSAKAFEQCLEMARQLGDEDEVALNVYNVADSSLSAGDFDRALEFANQAVAACAGREKVAFLRPMAGGISAYVRALRQGDAGAKVELEQWIVDADEHGYLDQQLDARFFLASVLEKQGLRAEALAVARTGQEMARQAESAQSIRRFTDLIAKLQ
jgi:tetratricopeptide (TPR) repeat protein